MDLDKWVLRLGISVFFITVFTACKKTKFISNQPIEYLDMYFGYARSKGENFKIPIGNISKLDSIQVLSWSKNKEIQKIINSGAGLLLIDIPNGKVKF